jgi:hypothetical protein
MHTRTSRNVIALPGQVRAERKGQGVRTELAGAQRAEGRGAEMLVQRVLAEMVQKE